MNQDSKALYYLPQEQCWKHTRQCVTWFLSVHMAHNSNELDADIDKEMKVQFKQTTS